MADFLHVAMFHEFLGGYDVFRGLPTMLAWVHAHACIHANFKVVPLTVVILHTQITSTPILVRIRSRVRFSSNMGDSRPTTSSEYSDSSQDISNVRFLISDVVFLTSDVRLHRSVTGV